MISCIVVRKIENLTKFFKKYFEIKCKKMHSRNDYIVRNLI